MMLPTDQQAQREKAAALARALAPVIERHYRPEPVTLQRPKPVARDPKDEDLLAACRQLAAAVDRLDQRKFTQAEVRARVSLERAARKVSALTVKRRPAADVR